MNASNKAVVFAATFTIAYAVIYTIATEINLPLVSYHPVIGEIDLLWKPPRSGPAMYWYGWMLTAFAGAVVLAFVATLVPERLLQGALLLGALGAAGYFVISSIAMFVYANASIEMEFLKSRWLSAVAAVLLAAVIGSFVPTRWKSQVWQGWTWLVPVGTLAVLGYYLTPYFTR